jgi:hypothetical protein
LRHPAGWNSSSTAPRYFQSPPTVRLAAARSLALSWLNAFSIGLRSGLYGGSRGAHPAALIARPTAGRLWQARLSITTASPGRMWGVDLVEEKYELRLR